MLNILLTKYDGAILGPIANLLGYIMEGLYRFFNMIGSALFSTEGVNIALIIFAFTFVVRMLMMPLTFKQQKFSKMSSAMNPELQAIQKKYAGKKDNDSMMKMQEETKAVYNKYGVSPSSSCLPLLIQMPIFFALYRVLMYIPQLKAYYETAITGIGQSKIVDYIHGLDGMSKVDLSSTNLVIDKLATFTSSNWNEMINKIGASNDAVNAVHQINSLNSFCGINLSATPMALMGIALLIPVLAALLQWLTSKLMMVQNNTGSEEMAGANMMKSMNIVMPIFSGFICLSMSSGLGLYWIASSLVSIIQQLIINAHFNKVSTDELIKENIDKINKKRAKKGLPPQKITNTAAINTKNMNKSAPKPQTPSAEEMQKKEAKRQENIKKATAYYNDNAKPGSLASKANMVRKFDEKNMNNKRK